MTSGPADTPGPDQAARDEEEAEAALASAGAAAGPAAGEAASLDSSAGGEGAPDDPRATGEGGEDAQGRSREEETLEAELVADEELVQDDLEALGGQGARLAG